jgi:hypothetical protein
MPFRAARISVAAAFLVNGFANGTWVSRIPEVKRAAGLGTGALGLALLGMTVGALMAMPLSGVWMARLGSRRIVTLCTFLLCASLSLPAFASGWWSLALSLLAFGAASGAMDVSMNAQAVAVEKGLGRPIMSSFHGLWSVGGMGGAALGGWMASRGFAPLAHFAAVGAALAAGALVAGRWLLHEDAWTEEREPAFGRPLRALAGLGAIAFCALLGEGAVGDWSSLYLSRGLGAGPGAAAMGYAAFSTCMAAGRLSGDRLVHRFGPVGVVRTSGLMAAAGLLVALAVGQTWAAIAGFALVGAGFATVVPLVFSAAGNTPGVSPGPALASVATTGYLGFLAGPPSIGLSAEVIGLRVSLGIVAALSLAMALLAPTVRRGAPEDGM